MKKQKELPRCPGRALNTKPSATGIDLSLILIIVLAGIPFLLGRYFEINYPDPFDSAANVYDAQRILNGAKINIDFNQSPAFGTLLVNILGVKLFGFSEFGPKLIQAIMQGIALIVTFIALKKLMGRLPAAVAIIVAAIYTSSPFLAKFGNVKEQYMIACMMMAISFFLLRQTGGGWWWAVLAGAAAAWAPLFKETGISVIAAIGIFVILQPFLKNRTFKQTGKDIGLLLVGAFFVVIIPFWLGIIILNSKVYPPYHFIIQTLSNRLHFHFDWSKININIPMGENVYLSGIQKELSFSEQWPRVLRFYLALILPIALSIGSIVIRISKLIIDKIKKPEEATQNNYDRFVWLFATWWILDMYFVWLSPASYEQYYLPLTASGAITGSYLVAIYRDKLAKAFFKTQWVAIGISGLLIMVVMSWNIFFGRLRSAYSGMAYPERRYGYIQRWNEIAMRKNTGNLGYWELAGQYIRDNTKPTDKIYVWGWYPGIYLSAQRFSIAKSAFESEMHTKPPAVLEKTIDDLLSDFHKEMPKFIVDSRKQHLPLDRFKFELWPIVPQGFMGFQKTQLLPNDLRMAAEWEKQWGQLEKERFGEDEFHRFEIMGKFRKFVRENYEPINVFGDEVVLKLKTPNAPTTKTN